jgi:peptidoglycan/LPS O-acetylase OafA/YrhL
LWQPEAFIFLDLTMDALTSQQPRFQLSRRPELDGLRGAAVLVVMTGHAVLPVHLAGYIGVDIMFVVSGFLITSLLLREWDASGKISIGRFYALRALRLGPAFLMLLFATAVYTIVFAVPEVSALTWPAILIAASGLSNWATAFPSLPHPLGVLTHTWSLATQEQYYLVWPIVVLAALRFGVSRRTMTVGVAAGFLALLILRVWLVQRGAPSHRLYAGFDTHGADSIFIGCFVAFWMYQRPLSATSGPLLICRTAAICGGLFALGLWVVRPDVVLYVPYGFSTAIALTTAATIVVLLNPGALALRRTLSSGSLVGIGRISYGLYLWHFPLQYWLLEQLAYARGWPVTLVAILAIGVSFLAATLSYRFIERPMLRLKTARRPVTLPDGTSEHHSGSQNACLAQGGA